ncbi:MAG: hypothetical protein ACLT8C_05625 [Akkermansia muciniphila]
MFVNAVQEEVGCIGAGMITHRLRPDAAICIDVTHATDSPGLDKGKFGDIKLGGGPAVIHGTANHPNLVARLEIVADKNKIPLQHEAAGRRTGTDTDSIYVSRDGVASALVSVPLRYMHSPVETASGQMWKTQSSCCWNWSNPDTGRLFGHSQYGTDGGIVDMNRPAGGRRVKEAISPGMLQCGSIQAAPLI